ncbi:MAG: hypothetical protein WD716_12845 [Fimbriimonadaceae bacterium]
MRTVLALAALAALTVCNTAPIKPDFGLKVGNVWTYGQTSDGNNVTITQTALRFVEVKPQTHALEVKAEYSGGYEGYLYFGQNEEGFLSYFNSEMRGPGVDRQSAPILLAKMPFTKGLAWTWSEPFRGQTSGEVTQRDLDRMTTHKTANIVSENEKVTVPAGTYRTVHIRVHAESEASGARTEDHWFAFGVGLVKSSYTTDGRATERVLMAFTPGK